MKQEDKILVMTVAEYNQDADDYSENAFKWGFFEGLNAIRYLARQREQALPAGLFDETLKLRDAIYQALNQTK